MLSPARQRRYALALLGVSIAILAVGTWLRRALAPPKPVPARTESPLELERLQRLMAERRLRDLSAYLSDAADAAGSALVSLTPGGRSGVIWPGSAVILTTHVAGGAAAGEAIDADGKRIPIMLAPAPPETPFSAWKVADRAALPPTDAGHPQLGDWVIAAARNAAGKVVFAHGLYQGTAPAHCGAFDYDAVQSSAALSPAVLGGGIFTLDGDLLGFIGECEGRPIAIGPRAIDRALAAPVSESDRIEQQYGMRIADGRVVAVWNGSRADKAGLRPGDVLERPDLDALTTGNAKTLHVRRGRKSVAIDLPDEAATPAPVPAGRGLELDGGEAGAVTVSAVAADSPGAAAGIRPGDHILRIDRAPVATAGGVARSLEQSRGKPVLLLLDRDGRRWEALVAP